MSRIDVEQLKTQVDLAAVVEHYLGAPRRRAGRWSWWRCPFHQEKTGSFGVTPDNGMFKCFGCGAVGDVFEFVRRQDGLSKGGRDFITVVRKVASMAGVRLPEGEQVQREVVRADGPPADRWQARAREVVEQAEHWLWDEGVGAAVRRYLMEHRGLKRETVRAWRLGYWPNTTYEHPGAWGLERERDVWLPQGLVLPGDVAGAMWYVKFRPTRAVGFRGKYYGVPGGKTALLGADRWVEGLPLVLAEGEMDFYTVWQEGRDLVNTGTLGGAAKGRRGQGVDFGRWLTTLARFDQIYAAYDVDAAGQAAREALGMASERFAPVRVPYGEDINEFHTRGGRVRVWLEGLVGRDRNREMPSVRSSAWPKTLVFPAEAGLALATAEWRRLDDGRIEATFEDAAALRMTLEATRAIRGGAR